MKKEQFELKNVKIISGGKLHVEYNQTIEENGSINVINHKSDFPYVPHEDLIKVMDEFKKPLLTTLRFLDLDTIRAKGNIGKPDRDAFEGVKKYVDGLIKSYYDNTEISGISLAGGEDKTMVKIMGKITDLGNISNPINSPLIHCSRETYGIESGVEESTIALIDEVYAYLFEDKKSAFEQLEINE